MYFNEINSIYINPFKGRPKSSFCFMLAVVDRQSSHLLSRLCKRESPTIKTKPVTAGSRKGVRDLFKIHIHAVCFPKATSVNAFASNTC